MPCGPMMVRSVVPASCTEPSLVRATAKRFSFVSRSTYTWMASKPRLDRGRPQTASVVQCTQVPLAAAAASAGPASAACCACCAGTRRTSARTARRRLPCPASRSAAAPPRACGRGRSARPLRCRAVPPGCAYLAPRPLARVLARSANSSPRVGSRVLGRRLQPALIILVRRCRPAQRAHSASMLPLHPSYLRALLAPRRHRGRASGPLLCGLSLRCRDALSPLAEPRSSELASRPARCRGLVRRLAVAEAPEATLRSTCETPRWRPACFARWGRVCPAPIGVSSASGACCCAPACFAAPRRCCDSSLFCM